MPAEPAPIRTGIIGCGDISGTYLRSLARFRDVHVEAVADLDHACAHSVAAGLVTESGNLLSHAAVVAREYGLPAVVALTRATDLITDGALVEVDGGAGVVRLLERR